MIDSRYTIYTILTVVALMVMSVFAVPATSVGEEEQPLIDILQSDAPKADKGDHV